LTNYWPISGGTVKDVITMKYALSSSPLFVTDRFGAANGAIRVNSMATSWQVSPGIYYQSDTTTTM
jgi:hypothetical protein